MDTSIRLPCTVFNLVLPNSIQNRLMAMCVIPEPLGDMTSLGTSAYQVSAESVDTGLTKQSTRFLDCVKDDLLTQLVRDPGEALQSCCL